MDEIIKEKRFKELNIDDPFFDSLKGSYAEFADWFDRKQNEVAYVTYDKSDNIIGFLYLKKETGPITEITPPLDSNEALKIGTFKINPHDTKLGERYMKKVFDNALTNKLKDIYVTVFDQHTGLIRLFEKYGFKKYGTKKSGNGMS